MMDKREELINNVCIGLIPFGVDVAEVKNMLYMVLEPYEIMERSTELAEVQEDRNESLIKRFIIAKTVSGRSKRTIYYYNNTIQMILRNIGKTVDDITPDDIRYYLAVRQRRDHISKVTADNELRCLKSFFQYLLAEELIKRNPTIKVDRIKCERRKKEALTAVEIEKIRLSAEGEREKLVIEMLLSTGCRVSELVAIKLDEIDANKVLVHGKGAKDRNVYLNAKAMVYMDLYLQKRKDSNPYLFAGGDGYKIRRNSRSRKELKNWWTNPDCVTGDTHLAKDSIEAMMRSIAKRAGVEKANPHKFRRTCATMALQRGMPIEQVSKMLGHEEISTTQIYLDLSEDELEQAHKKYVI